ncbi:MAG: circadian clock protein KaiC, partial [Chloroflexi bacterium]
MLNGGLPKGRTILLLGGPGSGKTTLGVQFLMKGFQEHGEKGVFLSFDETKEHLFNEMGSFGWDLAA